VSTNSFYLEMCGSRGRPDAIAICHAALRSVLRPGSFAVDATAGNGHDTVMLAEAVGPQGGVLALDIQQGALDATRTRHAASGCAATLETLLAGHERMADAEFRARWPDRPSAIVFNLGYLPGGDHALTTCTSTTLPALRGALVWVAPGGFVAIVCYPGHPAGATEAAEVENFAASLPSAGFAVSVHKSINTARPAPFTLLIQRLPVKTS